MSALMARIAKLDFDRVYFGLGDPVEVGTLKAGDFVFCAADAELPEGVVRLGADCDLPPGKYRLLAPDDQHGPFWRFEPLLPTQQKASAAAPSLERAFYDLVKRIPFSGEPPASVAAWMAAYEQTLEGAKK